jgi:hypothetical protein
MTDTVQEFLSEAAKRRMAHATPAQLQRRRRVTARNRQIAEGVKRGPNAHKDGTFGKVKP